MRRSFLVLMLVLIPTLCVHEHISNAQDMSSVDHAESVTDIKHIHERDFFKERAFVNGKKVPPDVYDQAMEQWRKIPRTLPPHTGKTATGVSVKNLSLSSVTSLMGTVWTPIGPSPITQGNSQANGRVSSIAINPNNPNVIYQGASGGGVWRTIDGGANWTPLTDQQSSLGTGEPSAIAVDPGNTDTIYIGTSGRFVLNISKGILKSTDGGGSWIVLGSGFPAGNTGNAYTLFGNANAVSQGQSINCIIVDPTNSNRLYLAASIGLYYSMDGGLNWTQGINGGGDARSMVLDTTSPAGARILYAGVSGSGVRQSVDGGVTWTQILDTATTAVAAALTAAGGDGIGQVLVDLAPPASPPNSNGIQVLYVTMQHNGGTAGTDPLGFFRSTDQGGTWNKQTGTGMPTDTQGGFSFAMSVDPASPGDGVGDIIYLGAVDAAKSTDSGNTFNPVGPGMHVDSHSTWVFFKQPSPTPSIVLTGNDGGIWKSTDGGASWSGATSSSPPTINAGGLQTALFYNFGISPDPTANVSEGSTQDNGTVRTTGPLAWTDTTGGDGFDIAFDADPTVAYNSNGIFNSFPFVRVFKSTDSGKTWPTEIDATLTAANEQANAVNTDPKNTGYMYISGSSSLFQTRDGGTSFNNLKNFGYIVGKGDVAKANSNIVAVTVGSHGQPASQVWVSTNVLASPASNVTFTDITRDLPVNPPFRYAVGVAIDPNDPTVVYATLSGFGTSSKPQNVFRTTVGGTKWTDISPPVNAPVNAIALDGTPSPTAIYIGNDLGVMRSVDGGANWAVLDDVHFPNVPVTALAINPQARVLRAATYGRGVFELASPNGPVISVNAEDGLQFGNVCQGSSTTLTVKVYNVGTQDLVINSVRRLFGSSGFTVLPNPSTPLVISPNSEVDFTVSFTPTTTGMEQAQIRISSNDPSAPAFDLMATANVGQPAIDTLIPNGGSFGDVCIGSFKDLSLTINNSGTCPLSVSNVSSSSGQFLVASTVSFPVMIAPGSNLQVPIRFQPTLPIGAKSGTITVSSNDPTTPSRAVSVSGNAPSGKVSVSGSTTFGDVCAETLAEKIISVCNVGACNLQVTSASLGTCANFQIINNPFPATVSHDACLGMTIRFTPTSAGPKACTVTITSDDPDTPTVTLPVTANTPLPSIDVSPDIAFPPTVIQSIGSCQSLKPFPISNKGNCNLNVTSISIGGDNGSDFSFSGLPSFPVILQPGHIVGEGNLKDVFKPTALDRDRLGTITVTYESDPIAHSTTSVTRQECGEGVRTGARVLVTAAGIPLTRVEKIQIVRISGNKNKQLLNTVDVAQNVPLTTVTPAAPCAPFQYHREYGTVSNPIQLLPGSYQITASAIVNGKRVSKTVGFSVDTCGFNPTVIIGF